MPDWLFFVILGVLALVAFALVEWIGVKLLGKLWPDESEPSDTLPVSGWAAASYALVSLIVCGVGILTMNVYVFGAMLPVAGVFYVFHFRRQRHYKRKKLGLCLKCGYDLRASKDKCPECGNEFETT